MSPRLVSDERFHLPLSTDEGPAHLLGFALTDPHRDLSLFP